MSEAMRYDPTQMMDHVGATNSRVAQANALHDEAQNQIESIRSEWTGTGFNGCDEAHRQVAMAFQQVFQTIGRHGKAIGQASDNAGICDSGVGAGFQGI